MDKLIGSGMGIPYPWPCQNLWIVNKKWWVYIITQIKMFEIGYSLIIIRVFACLLFLWNELYHYMYLFMVKFVIKVCLDFFFSFLSCFFFGLLALVHPSLSFPMGKKRVIMRGSWNSKTLVTKVFYIYWWSVTSSVEMGKWNSMKRDFISRNRQTELPVRTDVSFKKVIGVVPATTPPMPKLEQKAIREMEMNEQE